MASPHKQNKFFVVWWHKLDRWVVPTTSLLHSQSKNGWISTKINEVVRIVTERVQVKPDLEYKMAGVRWYGEGVFHRETVRGDAMSARYVTPLKPRALIYNRLFAWKSSFAVVPELLSDCYVSNEFPQFQVDETKLLPEYLYLFCILPDTIRAVNAASTGSSAVSRNRFKEEFFFDMPLPLPPLPIQQSIVSAWEQAQSEITEYRKKISDLEEKIESDFLTELGLVNQKRAELPKCFGVWWKDVERWSVLYNQLSIKNSDLSSGKFPVTLLGKVATISYGIQKCPANRPGQHARPYLRVANVQRGELDLREIKTINVPDKEMPSYRLESRDLLVCEGNSSDLVGRPAIWRGEIQDCVHQNHILKVRVNLEIVLPEYILEYMNSSPARKHFRSRAKFTTNLASINSNDLRELKIPIPPLDFQETVIAKITKLQDQIHVLKNAITQKAKQAKADIEDMILGEKYPSM